MLHYLYPVKEVFTMKTTKKAIPTSRWQIPIGPISIVVKPMATKNFQLSSLQQPKLFDHQAYNKLGYGD